MNKHERSNAVIIFQKDDLEPSSCVINHNIQDYKIQESKIIQSNNNVESSVCNNLSKNTNLDDIELRKQRLRERKLLLRQKILKNRKEQEDAAKDNEIQTEAKTEVILCECSTIHNDDDEQKKEKIENSQAKLKELQLSNHIAKGNTILKLEDKLVKLTEKRNKLLIKGVHKKLKILQKKRETMAEVAIWKMKLAVGRKNQRIHNDCVARIESNRKTMKWIRREIKDSQKDLYKVSMMFDKIQINNDSLLDNQKRLSSSFTEMTQSTLASFEEWTENINEHGDNTVEDNLDEDCVSGYGIGSSHGENDSHGMDLIQIGHHLDDQHQILREEKCELMKNLHATTEKYYLMGQKRYCIQKTVDEILKLVMQKSGVKSCKLRREITEIANQIIDHTIKTFADLDDKYGPIKRTLKNFPPPEYSNSFSVDMHANNDAS